MKKAMHANSAVVIAAAATHGTHAGNSFFGLAFSERWAIRRSPSRRKLLYDRSFMICPRQTFVKAIALRFRKK